MSMRHVLDAAATTIKPASLKLALMAVADDASDTTNLSWPGLEKVQSWSGVGKRRALELIATLIEMGYLESVSPGMPGKRAVYRVTIPAQSQPVDNSQIMGAFARTPQIMGAENRDGVRGIAPLSVNPLRLTQSSSDVTTEPVDNSSDDDDAFSIDELGWLDRHRYRRLSARLDLTDLVNIIGPVLEAENGIDPAATSQVVTAIAYEILGKGVQAGTRVAFPNAYIIAAVQREPEVWRRRAFELEAAAS